MQQDVGGKKAEEIASDDVMPAEKLIWHEFIGAVGNVKNKGRIR